MTGRGGRALAAIAAGNALEFYDFLIFQTFAIQIGAAFFPKYDAYGQLLWALATFGVGFLTRPLGSVVIGRFGDRVGRRPAMLLSFALTGLAMAGLALTPAYASIGIAAPLLAMLLRLVQGFALGGEVGPSTALMIETAPADRRGFYIAFQHATQYAAILLSGLVGLVLAHLLSPAALAGIGWRIAFLLGAAAVPYGYWLRRGLTETLPEPAPPPPVTAGHARVALTGLFLLAATSISIYVVIYMSTYAIRTLGFAPGSAFVATVASGIAGFVCALLGGRLSDRIGRKRVMGASALALFLLVLPAFAAVNAWRTPAALLATSGLLGGLLGLCGPPVLASIAEGLPPGLRGTGLGLVYALANAIFGGTAQFIVTWLIHVTGSPLAPAWYMMAALAVGLAAVALARETAPARIRSGA